MSIMYKNAANPLSFSEIWHVLGPFQIGTREATWGADPLEHIGGFCNISIDGNATFRSSLAPDGSVSWSQHQWKRHPLDNSLLDIPASANVSGELNVEFPSVNWLSLQSVYGWAALQWQAWTRGILTCYGSEIITVCLYVENVLEFWLDDEHFFGGDYYAYRRQPLILQLAPGDHVINIRLVRDVRLFGGIAHPGLVCCLTGAVVEESLLIHSKSCLFPEAVNNKPAGQYGSVQLTNATRSIIRVEKVDLQDTGCLETALPSKRCFSLAMQQASPLLLLPGQSRPLIIRISFLGSRFADFKVSICYTTNNSPIFEYGLVNVQIKQMSLYVPHRVTFLHPSGIVSYAILRPPSRKACVGASARLGHTSSMPIALVLHGAGVDVNDSMTRRSLDGSPDLPGWVLMPSGVTTWSGDDWHEWGSADVEAAIDSISSWIELSGWDHVSADTNRWLVIGHSNGGQGVWHILTHKPDKIIGAAPLSGYSSIQAYVPYGMWNEAHPCVELCIQNALLGSRHETLVSNFAGIPILIQHGKDDENVPVFHSRRMYQLISQTNGSSSTKYVELENKGHWFEGALTTPPLLQFYEKTLRQSCVPPIPLHFTMLIPDPAGIGSRAGLKIDALKTPDQIGKMIVERNPAFSSWTLTTRNISQFHLVSGSYCRDWPSNLIVDGELFERLSNAVLLSHSFVLHANGRWSMVGSPPRHNDFRYGLQSGPLNSILRSPGHFTIRSASPGCSAVSLQVARNLHQYFAADVEFLLEANRPTTSSGNLIQIAIGQDDLESGEQANPVTIGDSYLILKRANGCESTIARESGIGAVYLRPATNKRLELVVWGSDEAGLRQAARLLPLLTGVGLPELIIVSKRCASQGSAGVVAMGSLTKSWRLSESSYVS